MNLKVCKNVGIISYNETGWKRFILDGITFISTSSKKIDGMVADVILNNDLNSLFQHTL